jgi:leader peptidase (prepilin peptidase)/N-methyltransferase
MDFENFLLLTEIDQPWPPLWMMELAAKVLLGVWIFFFGACVGSFLNVVIYRLPRGMSLVHPGSRCPTCGHAIRGWDNIPLVSWLLLRGKCRDCSAPISARYYYVELTVGLVFLLTAFVETGGRGAGYGPSEVYADRQLLRMDDGLPFWLAYATHVVMLTTLIGAALIESDGFRPPRRLFLPMLAIGLGLPLVFPQLRHVPLFRDSPLSAWQAGLAEGLAGFAAGALAGLLVGLCWWGASGRRLWPRAAPVLVFGVIGLVMGWQRVLHIAPGALILTALLTGLVRLCGRKVVVPLAAVTAVAAWIQVVELDSNLHFAIRSLENTPVASIALRAAMIGVFAALLGLLTSGPPTESPLADLDNQAIPTPPPETPAT